MFGLLRIIFIRGKNKNINFILNSYLRLTLKLKYQFIWIGWYKYLTFRL